MDNRLRAAVIGVGYLGRFHAQKYATLSDVELVGVADIDAEAAARVAAQCQTTAFTDYRQLLDQVDVASIVVPTPLHHTVARDFLLAGVDVLVEKPITTTLAEADELIALAEEQGRILQVGHLERFNPAVQAMRRHITLPLFIEAHRIHRVTPRGTDVDVVLDLIIHDLDLVLALVDSPLESVDAFGGAVFTPAEDMASAILKFENGAVAHLTANRVALKPMRRSTRLLLKSIWATSRNPPISGATCCNERVSACVCRRLTRGSAPRGCARPGGCECTRLGAGGRMPGPLRAPGRTFPMSCAERFNAGFADTHTARRRRRGAYGPG